MTKKVFSGEIPQWVGAKMMEAASHVGTGKLDLMAEIKNGKAVWYLDGEKLSMPEREYTDCVLTWGMDSYSIVLNGFLENGNHRTEVKISKHEEDECLWIFDVWSDPLRVHEYMREQNDSEIERMIKTGVSREAEV